MLQRPRLVVAAKGLKDFDIVNIKLRDNLPEWYPSINPFRKVPAIEFPDGDAIYESLVLCGMLLSFLCLVLIAVAYTSQFDHLEGYFWFLGYIFLLQSNVFKRIG